jgi:6-phosphogluconolactonase
MKKHSLTCSLLAIGILIMAGCKSENYRLFVGGFTVDTKAGMAVFDFDSATGVLKQLSQTVVGSNPSYFCYSQRNKLVYVLNEVMEYRGEFGGGLTTFKYNPADASFERKNQFLIPYGGPCYISMSPDSAYLFVASYPNGSVAVVRLDSEGIPETVTDTVVYYKTAPKPSHAHMIMNDPSGKKVYVTDLGLDRIMIYDFDSKSGMLSRETNDTVNLDAGSGPRHFTFSDDGTRMYVINELGSKMMTFDVDAQGGLKLLQTLPTFRDGYKENNYCADVHLSKNGKFLYGSNRGENTIVTFRVKKDGTLELAGHTSCGGNWPRNFTLDPSGKFLLVGNQKSDEISVFGLNRRTGMPELPAKNFKTFAPACLKFYN